MRCSTLLFSAMLLAASVPHGARAADPTSAPAVERTASDRADELTRKGNALSNKDHWAEAEPLFREAWSLKQSYDIGGNLGIAEAMLGKSRDAAEHLSFALRTFPANGKPAHRKLLEETLAKVRAQVAAVTVRVSVQEATVLVDGKAIGVSPIPGEVFVDPGAHTVEAELKDYPAAEQSIQVGKGEALEVTLTLAQRKVVTPPTPPPPPPPAGPNKAIVIAGGATAGTGLIAGVIFTVVANGKARAADKLMQPIAQQYGQKACLQTSPAPSCDALHQAREPQYTFSNLALWTFAGAGVIGAGTAIYALTARRGAPKTAVRITPIAAAQGGGFLVSGAW